MLQSSHWILVVLSIALGGCNKSGGDSAQGTPAGANTATTSALPQNASLLAKFAADKFQPETARGKIVIADLMDWMKRSCACSTPACAGVVIQKPPLEIGHTEGMTERENQYVKELNDAAGKCLDAASRR